MSVLGTFTPLGERSRNGSYRRVGVLYVLSSAVAAGLLALALEALVAAATAVPDVPKVSPAAIAAVFGATMVGFDLAGWTDRLPHLRRQVNDRWLGRLRPSVYAIGFGAQLGFAFTTYVVTAATYAAFAFAALTRNPLLAIAIGLTFGLVRGSLVWIGRSAEDAVSLANIHRSVLRSERRVRLGLRAANALVTAGAALLAVWS